MATVGLHDISDVESFVCTTIQRSKLLPHIDEAEREELFLEGITILYELAEKFEPHRAGYATAGRFSGFAAQFLPRRLGDAWHQRHPEHQRITGPDGKRRWHYSAAPLSFDQVLSPTGNTANDSSGHTGNELAIRPRAQWTAVTAG